MNRPAVLVVGSGPSALAAAREVAAQGGKAILAASPGPAAEPLSHLVACLESSELAALTGSPGRFTASLMVHGEKVDVQVGAVVVALDQLGDEGAGDSGVLTLKRAEAARLDEVRTAAIVLGPGAPRSAHRSALELALRLRMRPCPIDVTLFTGEVLAHGRDELLYRDAQAAGATLVRTVGAVDIVGGERPTVRAVDHPSGLAVGSSPDLLVVEGAPSLDLGRYSSVLSVPVDGGAFIEAGVSRGPCVSVRDGVFLCGSALNPLPAEELEAQARSAATRALTSARTIADEASAASVDPDKCSACLTCMRSCPFSAPRIGEEGKAEVVKALCQACGICVGACPSRAISLPSDASLGESLKGMEGQ